jgi:hypothetical protein
MRRALILFIPLFCAVATPSIGTCGPLLNEIMADPASDWDGDGAYSYKSDEFAEIVNPGPGSLNLSGYYLADEAGGFVYGFEGTLAPGAVRVVYGSESVTWESSHGASTTGLRLGNDGDTILLKQIVSGDTLTVDAYTYNTYEAEDDRSSGRYPNGGSEWQLFDALNRYTGSILPLGNGLPPTPGQSNGSPMVQVSATTWGGIKALYAGE